MVYCVVYLNRCFSKKNRRYMLQGPGWVNWLKIVATLSTAQLRAINKVATCCQKCLQRQEEEIRDFFALVILETVVADFPIFSNGRFQRPSSVWLNSDLVIGAVDETPLLVCKWRWEQHFHLDTEVFAANNRFFFPRCAGKLCSPCFFFEGFVVFHCVLACPQLACILTFAGKSICLNGCNLLRRTFKSSATWQNEIDLRSFHKKTVCVSPWIRLYSLRQSKTSLICEPPKLTGLGTLPT